MKNWLDFEIYPQPGYMETSDWDQLTKHGEESFDRRSSKYELMND